MKSLVLGYPRIGEKRELKKAIESFWKKNITAEELSKVAKTIRNKNWLTQQNFGIDLISSNDFSLYDQMLDMSITLGCIPERFQNLNGLEQYFAMARGLQKEDIDVTAMEMTKWFDTNYHYIVPEFVKNQTFELNAQKIITEYKEALEIGIKTKPVIIGPVTFLLLGKEKEAGFNRLDLLNDLLPVYRALIKKLSLNGVEYVQIDEAILATELSTEEQQAFIEAYQFLSFTKGNTELILTNYFDSYGKNLDTVLKLPFDVLHLDLVRAPKDLEKVLNHQEFDTQKKLSLGVVNGRNVWKNNFQHSLQLINKAKEVLADENIWISSSCSLLHSPYDLDLEENSSQISAEVKQWLAFAKQKLNEINVLKKLAFTPKNTSAIEAYNANKKANKNRAESALIHNPIVKQRVKNLTKSDSERLSDFSTRQQLQKETLKLPLFPTTTIGSFPQTKEVRKTRALFKKGELHADVYNAFIEKETEKTIRFQENIGLDVLVHGEFERNDMVEYFGEQLEGFVFTEFGWVQSYGSRCVKPPIIFGDVHRPNPMTIKWATFSQSLTDLPVKGMLTGPVTILQWSFVRDDQSRATTCNQIALAIRDEVLDLEKAGIKIIQIDEPAIREGLPLKQKEWENYLNWAIKAFRISASGVENQTQIHTHMCYSEFNDIIKNIANMDADVITIETSRSEMELLDAFVKFKYPNEIGPGVYDIHSPRVPTQQEIINLLQKATNLLPIENIWVNPDCGLKTRDWPETKSALENLVQSAKVMRKKVALLA